MLIVQYQFQERNIRSNEKIGCPKRVISLNTVKTTPVLKAKS